jgi:hypothetical protein
MKKALSLFVFVCSAALAVAAQTPAPAAPMTGKISDAHCGATHKAMEGKKVADRDCTEMCIKGGAKYVFVSKDKVYQIADQKDKALATHAGHTVLLSGDVKGDTVTVAKIEMPKEEKK